MPKARIDIITSGQGTTNDLVWGATINTMDYGQTILQIQCFEAASGVRYSLRGFTYPGTDPFAICSGTLNSGDMIRIHSGLFLCSTVKVGLESEVDGESGLVSVLRLSRGVPA